MNARARVGLVTVLALAACEPGAVKPRVGTRLSLDIVAAPDLASAPDAGTIHVEGPTNRTVSILPGQTQTISSLSPGNYTVSLEAFVGGTSGQVVSFGQTTATVVAGQNTQATITLSSFVPTNTNAVATSGTSIHVTWGPVSGAVSYEVDRAQGGGSFTAIATGLSSTSYDDSGLSASVQYTYVVRAQDRFGSNGLPSASAAATVAGPPPTVTKYDIVFHPVIDGCATDHRGFRTVEELNYQDAEGDFPSGSDLTEPVNVQSQYRFDTDTNWQAFFAGKSWTPTTGSDGSSGTLQQKGSTCWIMPTGHTYLDFRVRLGDTLGNVSDWVEQRAWLPTRVTLTQPTTLPSLAPGATQQFSAVAYDANGDTVPGNPINWSSYTGTVAGSISAGGLYTAANSSSWALDRVYARAGAAHVGQGTVVQGTSTGGTEWYAPCWWSDFSPMQAGASWLYPLPVYASREYQLTLEAWFDSTATGNTDLYIRADSAPTTTVFDARTSTPGVGDTLTWTAPNAGVLWIRIYAQTASRNVEWGVTTTDGNCGFPGTETLPSASPAAAPRARTSQGPPDLTPASRAQEGRPPAYSRSPGLTLPGGHGKPALPRSRPTPGTAPRGR